MRLGYFWDLTGIEEEEVSSLAYFPGALLCFDPENGLSGERQSHFLGYHPVAGWVVQ